MEQGFWIFFFIIDSYVDIVGGLKISFFLGFSVLDSLNELNFSFILNRLYDRLHYLFKFKSCARLSYTIH